ncbi:hypothetical protein [Aquabacterium sp.]|uniref:hypothetical protein n=1 Tax=Aquabacterium sp. TaxID=1872578 RepID=UPI0019A5E54B|nr:hypothetical protein [Aquabacterium sp.]MBC7701439.1 hypothetical protein [Aquabacterium sp.]
MPSQKSQSVHASKAAASDRRAVPAESSWRSAQALRSPSGCTCGGACPRCQSAQTAQGIQAEADPKLEDAAKKAADHPLVGGLLRDIYKDLRYGTDFSAD